MNHLHFICKICKTHPGIRSREIYTCDSCFSKTFIKKFSSIIKEAYETDNLVIFDGTINCVVLFFMLKTKINPFFFNKFVFISNEDFSYENINRENYMYADIPKNKLNWLKKYNCSHLIKPDSINVRVQNIFKSICHLDLISVTKDFKPFADLLDDEIKRFFDINKASIYNPVSAEVPVFLGFNEINHKFCNELTNWNPSSLFNISKVYKKIEEKKEGKK
ncbi:hypothetical protein CDIK_0133 [Cucumispora dikerogammari]|nr:hypothetical protein CDIK_0133 [Cucumispora dikerogammari]